MSWPLVSLGSLEGGKGNFVDGPFGSNLKSSEYTESGVPLIQLKNIKPNKYITKDLKFVSQEKADSISRHSYKSGDVCIAKLGAVGTACIIPDDAPDGIIVADVVRFRGDKSLIDYKYFCHFLNSPEGQRRVLDLSRGSTRTRTNLTDLKKVEIPLPPLDEQKRIAAILDKADAIRRKRQQAIQLADNFLRSVFLDMFGDPVTNPKGFPLSILSDFYINPKNATKCGPFGSALKKHEYVEDGVPVWNMDNISLNGKFTDSPRLWITKNKYFDLEAYSVENGDVIISRAGTVGKMGVVRSKSEHSIISTNLIRVRFGEKLRPEYFVNLMNYCKGRVGRLKTGPDGAFTHMNTGILDKLQFPYPDIELQDKFIEIKEKVISSLEKSEEKDIDNLFNSLSQKAFAGEL